MSACPFCSIDSAQTVRETETPAAFFDAFPVSEGDILVVPRRHVASIYELSTVEQTVLWEMVGDVRRDLISRFGVDAFNIGVNDGLAAGQTISHSHIQVIPRRPGDVEDSRGGVRWVIAEKAAYWL